MFWSPLETKIFGLNLRPVLIGLHWRPVTGLNWRPIFRLVSNTGACSCLPVFETKLSFWSLTETGISISVSNLGIFFAIYISHISTSLNYNAITQISPKYAQLRIPRTQQLHSSVGHMHEIDSPMLHSSMFINVYNYTYLHLR